MSPLADNGAPIRPGGPTADENGRPTHRKSGLPRNPMPEQEPKVRARNFEEVGYGYTAEQAKAEAERCIQCPNPKCEQGCPVSVRIRDFIGGIINDDMEYAVAALKDRTALPAVCGRVCPQETQCEEQCILSKMDEPVAIGRLERYVADYDRNRPAEERCCATAADIEQSGHRVAVIGAGPAGLACARDLAMLGHGVTIFESLHTAGGVLAYGIPEFRLPKAILHAEVDALEALGVEFKFNEVIGKIATAEELISEDGFSAVFVASGAGLPVFLGVPGENLNGVYSANEFLTRVNLMRAYDFPNVDTPIWRGNKVIVIGGGNTAMDASRTALRLGAQEVYLTYRRTEAEMPARLEEIHHAKEEGVMLRELVAPLEMIGDMGQVTGMRVAQMELGEPDASGRRRPVPVQGEGAEYVIECDTVIVAVGTRSHPLTREVAQVDLTERGNIKVNEFGQTSNPAIFAGGDSVTGGATVILAMGAGKDAAVGIDRYIRSL